MSLCFNHVPASFEIEVTLAVSVTFNTTFDHITVFGQDRSIHYPVVNLGVHIAGHLLDRGSTEAVKCLGKLPRSQSQMSGIDGWLVVVLLTYIYTGAADGLEK